MGASIAFLILALRGGRGAVGVRLLSRLRIARYSRYRERQPYFRHARAFALDHLQSLQTKIRLQLPSSGDNAHTAAQPCANLTGERGNRTYLPAVFVLDEVPLMHSADRALRGDGDMKGRFALALLASVAVIAAMATDCRPPVMAVAEAADMAAAVVDSMAAVVAASTWAAAAASMRWVAAACAWVVAACVPAAAAYMPMHSAAAISARCARAACTDMRGAILAPAPSPIRPCLASAYL